MISISFSRKAASARKDGSVLNGGEIHNSTLPPQIAFVLVFWGKQQSKGDLAPVKNTPTANKMPNSLVIPRYTPELKFLALALLRTYHGFQKTSNLLNIPLSVLTRWAMEDALDFSAYVGLDEIRKAATDAVLEDENHVVTVAREYNVPTRILYRWLNSRIAMGS